MLAIIAFLCTLYYVPHYAFVSLLIVWAYRRFFNKKTNNFDYKSLSKKQILSYIIIGTIIILSFINNQVIGSDPQYPIPYNAVMLISILAACVFNKRDAKILVTLIALESIVTIIEGLLGITSIFPELYLKYSDSIELLYFRRSFGLSDNSSLIAAKILLAVLIMGFYKFRNIRNLLLYPIFLGGLIYSFNRTVILVVLIYLCYVLLKNLFLFLKKSKLTNTRIKKAIVISLLLFSSAGIGLLTYEFREDITKQFEGHKSSITSGRDNIWKTYYDMIENSVLLGNHSNQTRYGGEDNLKFHAHNSFIQCLADHGIIIFLLYISLIAININRRNWLYIGMLSLYSLTQYGFFWGVSLMDIVLYVFIFNKHQLNWSYNLKQPIGSRLLQLKSKFKH